MCCRAPWLRGAARDGDGVLWEIHGTEGDIRISGSSGHTQMVQLSLQGARGEEKTCLRLEAPASYRAGWPAHAEPGNVARLYANMACDLREDTRRAPIFEDAVAVHRIIAAIEGKRNRKAYSGDMSSAPERAGSPRPSLDWSG